MPEMFEVDFHQEFYCDGPDVVHFHFEDECPACHSHRAGTDQYQGVLDCIADGGIFSCQECKTKFKILEYEYAGTDDREKEAVIEKIT